jgi:hypothetical protein
MYLMTCEKERPENVERRGSVRSRISPEIDPMPGEGLELYDAV